MEGQILLEELYSVLISLTESDAEGLVKGMADFGGGYVGFLASKVLQNRYDITSTAVLLQAYLEVVAPPKIKGISDVRHIPMGIQNTG